MTNYTEHISPEDSSETSTIRNKIENSLKFVEATLEITRIRIIGALFTYQKLSMEELCHYVGKSWPTIDKHAKILVKAKVILTEEINARGPNKKKLYSINPEYYENVLWFNMPKFAKMETPVLIEYLKKKIQLDRFYSQFFQYFIQEIIHYTKNFEKDIVMQYNQSNPQIIEYYMNNSIGIHLMALDETEDAIFDKKMQEYYLELQEYRQKLAQKGETVRKPRKYCNFIVKWPNDKVYESRANNKWQ